MRYDLKTSLVAAFAWLIASCGAFAQTPGTATNHAFLLGKGAGNQGYTSLLCTSAQLAVGQASADPICKTITGDVAISAAGVTAIGATVVHSSMLNADVFSTAHSWTATQSFPNNSLTLAEFPTIGASTVIGSVAGGTPVALTQTQITALINAATASLSGALPAWPNNTTTYFRGDGTYATLNFAALGGQATLAQFPTGVSDTALGYWGSTAASALAINNCTGALTYSTTTHTFGCNASAGTGTVTSATVAAGGGISVSGTCTITTTGTCTVAQRAVTKQVFAAGASGTYTTPAGVQYIEIEIIGGGGGGAGGNGTTATVGNSSCWNTTGAACTTPVYSAGGGAAGAVQTNPGTGPSGGAVTGSGTCDWSVPGSAGGIGAFSFASTGSGGGKGGDSSHGGGASGSFGAGAAGNGATNSGGGGGGGGQSSATSAFSGQGGAGGATCHVIINSPAATYTYAVAATAAGSAAGTGGGAGGAGAGGQIIVYEH